MEQYPENPTQPAGPSPQLQQRYFIPPQRTNGKAIAALVLGILAIVLPYIGFIIGIIAIIFASLALKEIKTRSEQGRGLAVAGLVCGIVGTALYAIIIVVVIGALLYFGSTDSMTEFSTNYSTNI
jgi:uncharacterized paraquat-inducible protein A